MKLPSGSVLQRAMQCPASMALPQVKMETSDAANRGTMVHGHLAKLLDASQVDTVLDDETAEYVEKINIADVLKDRTVHAVEATFLFSPLANLYKEAPRGDFSYRNSAEWIGGTADLILQEVDGSFTVVDYKTGSTVEHPRENKQLLFFAFWLWHELNVKVAGEIAFLDPFTGKVTLSRASYDEDTLVEFHAALLATVAEIGAVERALKNGQPFTTHPGAGCKYCPAFALCPSQRHLAKAMSTSPSQGLLPTQGGVGLLSPREAGAAWVRLKELKQLLGRVEYELRCYAEATPIPLPDGTQLRLVRRKREALDATITREFLRTNYNAEVADDASEYKVSKTSLKKALTSFKAKASTGSMGSVAKAVELALDVISDRGGVKVTEFEALTKLLPSGEAVEE